MPEIDGLSGGDAGKGEDEEVVQSKELWRQHERERGEASMEYLATRFAGFDGAAAIQHIFPLLNVCIPEPSSTVHLTLSSSSRLSTDGHLNDDGRLVSKFGEAAKLEALSALVAASSNAQREAYWPVLLHPIAIALSHQEVPIPQQDSFQMQIRFLYLTFVSLLTPVYHSHQQIPHTHAGSCAHQCVFCAFSPLCRQ